MTQDKMEEASIAFWYHNLVQMQPPPTLQYWADCQVYSAQESTETGSLSRFTFHYLVGADPDDTLTLQVKGGVRETFRMHSSAWRWSLDYLLYRYLTLALREGDQATITLRVPDAILKKYDSYKNQMTERKKELSIPTPAYLPKPSKRKNLVKLDGCTHFSVPRFLEPSHLNLFCHDIFTQPNNNNWLNDPRRDGVIFFNKDISTLPRFQLEDYIAHELKTGISLSTEITAIVLEMDEAIRDVALDAFYAYALKDLVRIPFPFARNTAARNFFQQISSEWASKKYTWNNADTKGREAEILAESFRHARIHIDLLLQSPIQPFAEQPFHLVIRSEEELHNILREEKACNEDPMRPRKYRIERDPATNQIKCIYEYPVSYRPEFPNIDDPALMDEYMEQIKVYLQVIRAPFDWDLINEMPPAHLALFTNQNHQYIPLLLRYLETDKMTVRYRRDTLPINVTECKALYRSIHTKIREMSMKAYANLHDVKDYLKQL